MNTILYIGDTYISTLGQLRQCVLDAFGNERKSTLMREIETLYRDGVLQSWLEQGDADEQWLANELKSIKKGIDSSKLCEHIALILTDELYSVNRNINDYVEVEKWMVYADGIGYDVSADSKYNRCKLPSKWHKLTVCVQCRVTNEDAETFRLSLTDYGTNVGGDFLLDLRKYSRGQLVDVKFELPNTAEHDKLALNLKVVADKQPLYSFCVISIK